MTPSSTLAATQLQGVRLTAEEQAVYDFVSHDVSNVRHFMEQVRGATAADTHAAIVTHIAHTDAILQTSYSKWLERDPVFGRVHTLERSYESVLRSMVTVNRNMKAALAAPTEAAAVAARKKAKREVPRLTSRVEWTLYELDWLTAFTGAGGA